MNDKKHKDRPDFGLKSSILDVIRQWRFPVEFWIAPPSLPLDASALAETESQFSPSVQAAEQSPVPADSPASNQFVAEVATCLWYLKTKHFKRDWEDDGTDDNGDDDGPRVRRTIGRLNRGIDALKENGIEIYDPTNERYPQGGEGMMRPIQFQPTAGLTVEMVTETVTPIVYRNDQLIQRAEVFVAVPKEELTTASQPAAGAEAQAEAMDEEDDHEDRPDGVDVEDAQVDQRAVANQNNASSATETASEPAATLRAETISDQDQDAFG